jgi:hypothetical protein
MGAIKLFPNSIKPKHSSNPKNIKTQNFNIDLKKEKSHNFDIQECSGKTVRVSSVLPFRIRFRSVDIAGYSSQNPPPIGIAIIGYSNYIL